MRCNRAGRGACDALPPSPARCLLLQPHTTAHHLPRKAHVVQTDAAGARSSHARGQALHLPGVGVCGYVCVHATVRSCGYACVRAGKHSGAATSHGE